MRPRRLLRRSGGGGGGEVGSPRPDERGRMLAVVAGTAARRLKIVGGVSAPDLATSRTLAREAAAGATLVHWQAPQGIPDAALDVALLTLDEAGRGKLMLQDLD